MLVRLVEFSLVCWEEETANESLIQTSYTQQQQQQLKTEPFPVRVDQIFISANPCLISLTIALPNLANVTEGKRNYFLPFLTCSEYYKRSITPQIDRFAQLQVLGHKSGVIVPSSSKHCIITVLPHESDFEFVSASQAKRTLKAQKLQDELASGKLDPTVSVRYCQDCDNNCL